MMVTCKEDLINTYIENDYGKLRRLYLETCERFGLLWAGDGEKASSFLSCIQFIGVGETLRITHSSMRYGSEFKKLTISDLKQCTTETPEESESLDAIAQVDSEEWKNGLPPIGVECEVYGALGQYDEWHKCEVFAIKNGLAFISDGDSWTHRPISEFKSRKPETQQQREEREQKKEMLDLVEAWCEGYNKSIDCSVAMRAVCDALFGAGYRKESK